MPDVFTPDPQINPENRPAGEFAVKGRSQFLSSMQRHLKAAGHRLFRFAPGDFQHTLLTAVAIELEKMGRSFVDLIEYSIQESALRNFTLFAAPYPERYAQGEAVLLFPAPNPIELIIPQGDLFGTDTGQTCSSTEEVVIPVGNTYAIIPVISDSPGAAGNIPPGKLNRHFNKQGPYTVGNVAAISGGRDAESRASVLSRFATYITSLGTANEKSLISSVLGLTNAGETITDATLIVPSRLPDLDANPSEGYLVVDNGTSGQVSNTLLSTAQNAADLVTAMGEKAFVIPAGFLTRTLSIRVEITQRGNTAPRMALITNKMEQVWLDTCQNSKIENGSGRGEINLFDLKYLLDRTDDEVLSVEFLDASGTFLRCPIGMRFLAGALTITFVPGVR